MESTFFVMQIDGFVGKVDGNYQQLDFQVFV